MFTFSRQSTEESRSIYLMLSAIDNGRPQRLSPATVRLLAARFPRYGNRYLILEFQGLDDASITHFSRWSTSWTTFPIHLRRANALGIFQANVGLWQILARQGQISPDLNES